MISHEITGRLHEIPGSASPSGLVKATGPSAHSTAVAACTVRKQLPGPASSASMAWKQGPGGTG